MTSRKQQPNAMSAFALREFILGIVNRFMDSSNIPAPWETREEGIATVEEILLEGRVCGIESRDGFEELCRTVITFKLKLPLSNKARQALTRSGLSELQRIEGLRLCLLNNPRDNNLTNLPRSSSN